MNTSMRLKKILQNIPHLRHISALSRKNNVRVWLVGGFLRDAYLSRCRQQADFDFCVEKNTASFTARFAAQTGGTLIVLDRGQGSYRVVVRQLKKICTYDFTRLRGKTIEDDVSLRDFTVNTLACDVGVRNEPRLLDFLGARKDLARRRIRLINEQALRDDPLRILRAFSLSAQHNFFIDRGTERFCAKYKRLLHTVSGERLNEELFKIFSSSCSCKTVRKMSDLEIIDEVLPHIRPQRGVKQGGFHHLDVWDHSLESLSRLESLVARKFLHVPKIMEYLNRPAGAKHTVLQLIKLVCLLHDAGKPSAKKRKNKRTIFYTHEKIGARYTDDVARALKLSVDEHNVVKKIIFWHLRPGYLADQGYPSRRAVYRFFRDTGDLGLAVLIFALADWRATRGPLIDMRQRRHHERVMSSLISRHLEEKDKKPMPRLVDGFDIMKKFSLRPSPLIGDILAQIREEQILGTVTNAKEAFSVARQVIRRAPSCVSRGQKTKKKK